MTILMRLAALEAALAACATSLDAVQKRVGAIEDDTAVLAELKGTVGQLAGQLEAMGAEIGSDTPPSAPPAANDAAGPAAADAAGPAADASGAIQAAGDQPASAVATDHA